MTDSYNRNIDYLRVSLTDRCNLRCTYCMPPQGVTCFSHEEMLTLEESLRLCNIFAQLGIKKIKVTGGEPFSRLGAADWIASLKKIEGIRQVTVTTNGVLLQKNLPLLQKAGLDAINISLDTLNRETFKKLTGFDKLPDVLQSLQAAAASGIPVKVNAVPLRGINTGEFGAIAALAQTQVKAVRFIELMPIGCAYKHAGVSLDDVKKELEASYGKLEKTTDKLGNGPAEYYSLAGFLGKIGFIAALSHEFCGACNRLRLTSDGMLKLCLAHESGTDLRTPLRTGMPDEGIKELILQAVAKKPHRHAFLEDKPNANKRSMHAIGG